MFPFDTTEHWYGILWAFCISSVHRPMRKDRIHNTKTTRNNNYIATDSVVPISDYE